MINQVQDQAITGWLKAHEDEMLADLKKLVAIESVATPSPSYPYMGEGVAQVLQEMLELCRKEGLETRYFDGWCADATWGEGKETIGVLSHLDTVPLGKGWDHDPLGCEIVDGVMYGRGTADDKGAAVASLYALRAVMAMGIELPRKIRLIFGGAEEIGMPDMKEYLRRTEPPEMAFSPDGGYPAIFAEKGITSIHFATTWTAPSALVCLAGGTRVNVVPEEADAVLLDVPMPAELPEFITGEVVGRELRLHAAGIPCHGSCPMSGRNAIALLLPVLHGLLPDSDGAKPALDALCRRAVGDWYGERMGISGQDEVSGPLTMNLGVIELQDHTLSFALNLRHPVTLDMDATLDTLRNTLSSEGFHVTKEDASHPLYQPVDQPLVSVLTQVYHDVTGDVDAKPFATGGGTYARTLPCAVAYGMSAPGSKAGGVHMANECISVGDPLIAARIYAHAMIHLAQVGYEKAE